MKKILILLAFAAALTGCSNNEENEAPAAPAKRVTITVVPEISRTSLDGATTTWEGGETVAIYLNGDRYEFTAEGSGSGAVLKGEVDESLLTSGIQEAFAFYPADSNVELKGNTLIYGHDYANSTIDRSRDFGFTQLFTGDYAIDPSTMTLNVPFLFKPLMARIWVVLPEENYASTDFTLSIDGAGFAQTAEIDLADPDNIVYGGDVEEVAVKTEGKREFYVAVLPYKGTEATRIDAQVMNDKKYVFGRRIARSEMVRNTTYKWSFNSEKNNLRYLDLANMTAEGELTGGTFITSGLFGVDSEGNKGRHAIVQHYDEPYICLDNTSDRKTGARVGIYQSSYYFPVTKIFTNISSAADLEGKSVTVSFDALAWLGKNGRCPVTIAGNRISADGEGNDTTLAWVDSGRKGYATVDVTPLAYPEKIEVKVGLIKTYQYACPDGYPTAEKLAELGGTWNRYTATFTVDTSLPMIGFYIPADYEQFCFIKNIRFSYE